MKRGGGGVSEGSGRHDAGINAQNLYVYTHIYTYVYIYVYTHTHTYVSINIWAGGAYLRPLSTSLKATAIQPSSSVLEAMTSARLPPATYMRKV